MNDNPNGSTPCSFDIPEYGPCGRPAGHIVHSQIGLSPREHAFTRPKTGIKETAVLSKRNLRRVARRSGRSIRELEIMRQTGLTKGKKITVEYDVVESEVRHDGLKADRVIMDEAFLSEIQKPSSVSLKSLLKQEGIEP